MVTGILDVGSLLSGVALLLLSILLATLEHGWNKLSRTRLADAGRGPAERLRVEQMLAHGDRAESALIVLRVATQVALIAWMIEVSRTLAIEQDWARPWDVVLGATVAFLWITVACRVLPDEVSVGTLETLVRATMPFIVLAGRVLSPPIEAARRLARKLTGHTPSGETELSLDEILYTVEEGERGGHLPEDAAEMIEQVLELSRQDVRELMTPRTEVDVIDVKSTVAEAIDVVRQTGHSRYPLVDGSVDHVVGMLHVKDLLLQERDATLTSIAREPLFVPETKSGADLLREFRKTRMHMAVVLDEYGGTSGLVTIEDVIEEIVGEIDDEFDEEEQEPLRIIDDAHAVASGTIHVGELNDKLAISLPESDDWSTLGGFIFHSLGRLPRQGEELVHENVRLTVGNVDERRIRAVEVEILQPVA